MTSYIQLLNKIEAFCLAHKQIQKYGGEFREQMPNFSTKDTKYPMVFVSPSGGAPLYDTNEITLDIYCVDIIQKGRENLNTIVSDCHLILTDLYIYFSQGSDLTIDVLGTPSQTPLNNLDLDYVAGWMMTITFQVEGWCVAAIPMGDIPSGQGCEDATYIVEYADGTPIETGTIASGASKTIEVPNCPACDSASWTLLDTDGNVLDSGTIPSGASANITAPDATYSNSDNSYFGNVLSGGSLSLPDITVTDSDGSTFTSPSVKNITCTPAADANVQNSDASYSTTVASGGTLTLPDSQINVNSVDQGDVVSVKTIDVNITDGTDPVTPDSVSLVGNTLTIQVPAGGSGTSSTLVNTGAVTSYVSDDDAANVAESRYADWFTLDEVSPFGNTDRFTSEDFSNQQTYTNNIVIDWSTYSAKRGTVLGYGRLLYDDNANSNDAITTRAALKVLGGFSGWRVLNVKELENIRNIESTGTSVISYAPFSYASTLFNVTTSSTVRNSLGNSVYYMALSNGTMGDISRLAGGPRYMICRTFTVTGTTLS